MNADHDIPDGLIRRDDGSLACAWHGADPLYRRYHDEEWGRPLRGDRPLFEKMSLEGFQAGLSWITILRKRENFRRAFANFDVDTVAAFGPTQADLARSEDAAEGLASFVERRDPTFTGR